MNGKRVHERFEHTLPVVLTHGGQELTAETRNVSLGGMYIVTPALLTFGDAIVVRVRLPSLKADSVLEATVRWKEKDGYGVQFGSLHALDVWGLNQLLKK
ncbi:MAG: PilZ domain-containing protein [Sandaracinaceae bacterium]|nr:PilZ domain-containing protein [Sandaracinaceae bacterium]